MLFNSWIFLLFFPLTLVGYYLTPHKGRWLVLLLASYVFYMWWEITYALLILVSTTVDYVAAIKMDQSTTKSQKKKWLWGSLLVNLGMLGFFKYWNFFSQTANNSLPLIGVHYPFQYTDLLLPIGISFYTFQTLSYSIDVYRGKIGAERNFGKFALFVSFFPQLVAGPIERAARLLPQFTRKVQFSYDQVTNGLKLMAWGFFKKLVIADRLAIFVDLVYNNPEEYAGWPVILATCFFIIQVYCDFSGYSDIAIGAAQVMGFRLSENFRRPFHAQTISDLWKRWHITLYSWLRDYVFIPLGGSRGDRGMIYRNILLTMLLAGFWHGAAWTYMIFGLLNGMYMVFGIHTKHFRIKMDERIGLTRWPGLHKVVRASTTFLIFAFSGLFFRAADLSDAGMIIENMFAFGESSLFRLPFPLHRYDLALAFVFIGIMEAVHIKQRKGPVRKWVARQPVYTRWGLYLGLIAAILSFGIFEKKIFVYFQF